MKKIVIVDGKKLHLILGKTEEEWKFLYSEYENLWSMPLEELLDGTLEINEDIWCYYINGRCYETDLEV